MPGPELGSLSKDGRQILPCGAGICVKQGHDSKVGGLRRTNLVEHLDDLGEGLKIFWGGSDEQAIAVAGVGRDLDGTLQVEGDRVSRVAADVELADLFLEFARFRTRLTSDPRTEQVLEGGGHSRCSTLLEGEDPDLGLGILTGRIECLDHLFHLSDQGFTSDDQ